MTSMTRRVRTALITFQHTCCFGLCQQRGPFHEAKDVTLRREPIVTVLTLRVIAAATPSAIVDNIRRLHVVMETGLKERK